MSHIGQVDFLINLKGGEEILKYNSALRTMEQDIMQKKLDEVKVRFLQDFGTEGVFELVFFTTNRMNYKVRCVDRKTGGILKRNPGWLNQFNQ